MKRILYILLLYNPLQELLLSVCLFQLSNQPFIHISFLLKCPLQVHLVLQRLLLVMQCCVELLHLLSDLLLKIPILLSEVQVLMLSEGMVY